MISSKACKICNGSGRFKCDFCGAKPKTRMSDEERRKHEIKVENLKYKRETWEKLKAFNSQGTGIPSLDAELIKMFGNWK